MPRVDWLGEPGLDGPDRVGVASRALLDDLPDADAVGAEAVQDGRANGGNKPFINDIPGF